METIFNLNKGKNMKLRELKTIDIQAKQWRDKINGNSYFSSEITLNYGQPNEERYEYPFAYGYGDQYEHSSLELVKNLFPKSKWFKSKYTYQKWRLKDEYRISVNSSIKKDCFQRELIHA